MKPDKPKVFDQRSYRRRSERRYAIAVVGALLIIGGTAIGIVYGWQAVFTGLACLIPGAAVFVFVWLLLSGLERLNKMRDE